MLCIVPSAGDATVNSKRKDMILAFMVYSLRKDYRLDASPVSIKETLHLPRLSGSALARTLWNRAEVPAFYFLKAVACAYSLRKRGQLVIFYFNVSHNKTIMSF